MQEKFKKIFQHFKNLENMFLETPRNVLKLPLKNTFHELQNKIQ